MYAALREVPGMEVYRAPSLFQPHKVRQAIRDAHAGKIPPLTGFYFGLSSVPLARFIAPFAYDMAWIDWEHTSCGVETMTTMVHEIMFMSEGKTMPFVRVPGHDHAAIGYVLDAGASVVVPQVETVEQARHVTSSAKFGTKYRGSRSAPPFRLIPGLTDMSASDKFLPHENLNEQAALMIQIETFEGVKNLDAILTECPDVDIVWLGSLDLRISMNLPANFGMGGDEPEWHEALQIFNETMKKHDKPWGGFAFGNAEQMKPMAHGKSLIMCGADVIRLMGCAEDRDVGLKVAKELQEEKGKTW